MLLNNYTLEKESLRNHYKPKMIMTCLPMISGSQLLTTTPFSPLKYNREAM